MRLLTKDFIKTVPMIFVTGLLVLTGCEKISQKRSHPIRPVVSTAATKGSITVAGDLNKSGGAFHMYAYATTAYHDNDNPTTPDPGPGVYFSEDVSYDSGWTITGEPEWLNDVNLYFWSYSPLDTDLAGELAITETTLDDDELQFTFTVATDVEDQDDLLFAYNDEKRVFDTDGAYTASECSGTGTDDNMTITFHHALSCIRFAVSPDDGTYDTSYGIRKISINNAYSHGLCWFDSDDSSFEWPSTNLSDEEEFDLSTEPSTGTGVKFSSGCPTGWTSSTFNTSNNLYTMDECFFMIPQEFGSTSDAEIAILFDDGVTRTFSLKNSGWEPDKYYTYKIKLSGGPSLTFSLSLLPWTLQEDEINLEKTVSVASGGQLSLSPKTSSGSSVAQADAGSVAGFFQLDKPVGAQWLVSVTNPDIFTVENEDNDTSNPATGTIDGHAQSFKIKVKPGVDRSQLQETKVQIKLRLEDGSYIDITEQLGADVWSIILNPVIS